MHIPETWWIFGLIGVVSGVLSATLGVGSGIIMVPILAMMSNGQKEAQGMALAAMVPMALVGALRYRFNPDIKINDYAILFIAVGGVFGALVGSSIAAALPAAVLRKMFSVLLVVAAVKMYTMK